MRKVFFKCLITAASVTCAQAMEAPEISSSFVPTGSYRDVKLVLKGANISETKALEQVHYVLCLVKNKNEGKIQESLKKLSFEQMLKLYNNFTHYIEGKEKSKDYQKYIRENPGAIKIDVNDELVVLHQIIKTHNDEKEIMKLIKSFMDKESSKQVDTSSLTCDFLNKFKQHYLWKNQDEWLNSEISGFLRTIIDRLNLTAENCLYGLFEKLFDVSMNAYKDKFSNETDVKLKKAKSTILKKYEEIVSNHQIANDPKNRPLIEKELLKISGFMFDQGLAPKFD